MGIVFRVIVLAYPVGVLLLWCVYQSTGKGKRLYDACFFGIFRNRKTNQQFQKELEEQLKQQPPKKVFKLRRRFPDFSDKNSDKNQHKK
jgi:hypothetical protein